MSFFKRASAGFFGEHQHDGQHGQGQQRPPPHPHPERQYSSQSNGSEVIDPNAQGFMGNWGSVSEATPHSAGQSRHGKQHDKSSVWRPVNFHGKGPHLPHPHLPHSHSHSSQQHGSHHHNNTVGAAGESSRQNLLHALSLDGGERREEPEHLLQPVDQDKATEQHYPSYSTGHLPPGAARPSMSIGHEATPSSDEIELLNSALPPSATNAAAGLPPSRRPSDGSSVGFDEKAGLYPQRSNSSAPMVGGYNGGHEIEKGESNHFEMAHGAKKGGYIAEMGANVPIRVAHLFKRPIIRQWIYDGKIYRETSERSPSRFELFFDLVFVAVVHKLADGAAEAATAMNVAKFAVVFYLSWSIWLDVRTYINQSGTDDVWQRLFILLMMILLAGYAGNATAVQIVDAKEFLAAEAESAAAGEGAHGGGAAGETAAEGLAGAAAHGETAGGAAMEGATASGAATETTTEGHAARALVMGAGWAIKRATEAAEEAEPDLKAHLLGPYYFARGWHEFIFWAIGFFLVAKCARLLLSFVYGLLLPRFRKALWLQGLFTTIIACIFLPIMFLEDPATIMILCLVGIVCDILIKYIVAASNQWLHGRTKHKGHHTFFPAVSVEHLQERMLLFSILVIGECILNSTYTATEGLYGFSELFGRCALAIIIAFAFMWITFDADGSRTFVHALRRHWLPAITFTNLYYPLCASMILMSSALFKLVNNPEVEHGYHWFFGGSLALAMASLATIACLHESLDLRGSALASTNMRILVRYTTAVIFVLIPIKKDWKSVDFLGIYAAILVVVVMFETFGKLGAVGRVYDAEKAAELERWRRSQRSNSYDTNANQNIGKDGSANASFSTSSHDVEMAAYGNGHLPGERMVDQHSRSSSFAQGMLVAKNNVVSFGKSKLDKDWQCPKATSRDPWHTYEDLSYDEKGEEDVGNEGELGDVEARRLVASRRWALASI